jgi:hypothetical protein
LTRPPRTSPRAPQAVRGKRNEPGPQVTIGSQLRKQPIQHAIPNIHVSNIGTIRNTLDDLAGEVHDYPDDEAYDEDGADYEDGYGDLAWPSDRRWRPIAAVGGALIAICAIGTAVIVNSGDSATTKGTVAPPISTPRTAVSTPSAPRTTIPPSAAPSPTRTSPLPPETVTTVPPSLVPRRTPTAAPPPTALPPSATLNPRTVVYTVTGSKQLVDLVNVVYTDARGYPQTVLNVALPWTKVVILNPGVQTESVIASSFTSQLNCSIGNAEGQTVIASAKASLLATCTR